MTEPKWKQAERNRVHYDALGIREVYLDREDEKPWHLATHCKPGGSHRMEISTDVWFYADDTKPAFRWSFDLEPSSANGAGDYQIDVPGVVAVLSKLWGPVRREFSPLSRTPTTSHTWSWRFVPVGEALRGPDAAGDVGGQRCLNRW